MAEEKEQNGPLDSLEQLIRSEPATLEEAGELAMIYVAGLREIARVNADNPLQASKETFVLTKRLIAGLSPAGSLGPAHLFVPFMEIILALETGASPAKTTLFKAARPREGRRPPDPPALVLGQAQAAAVMTMLMEHGSSENDAARLVANRLKRAGVKFDRSNANPINNVKEWRRKGEGDGHKQTILAYREALNRLRALITPENSANAPTNTSPKDGRAGRAVRRQIRLTPRINLYIRWVHDVGISIPAYLHDARQHAA